MMKIRSKKHRRRVYNSFCPTGKGGGIDPTCSPHGALGEPVSAEQMGTHSDTYWVTPDGLVIPSGEYHYKVAMRSLSGEDAKTEFTAARKIAFDKMHSMGYVRAGVDSKTEMWLDKDASPRQKAALLRAAEVTGRNLLMQNPKTGILEQVRSIEEKKYHSPFAQFRENSLSVNAKRPKRHNRCINKSKALRRMRVMNSFCPTGKGGGVDPSCSPGELGAGTIVDKQGQSYKVILARDGRTFYVSRPGSEELVHRGVSSASLTLGRKLDKIMSIDVQGEFQRRGIATALIKHVEGYLGKKLAPNWAMTDDGAALFKSYDGGRLFVTENRIAANAKRTAVNPLRADPTRMYQLRRRFDSAMAQRFKAIKAVLRKMIIEEDGFGLKQRETFNSFCPTGPGGGVDPHCSPGTGGGTTTVYHGTAESALASIAKLGIVAGGGKGGDRYEELGGTSYRLTYANIEGRDVSVFVSKDPIDASRYGARAAKVNNSEPVVLRLEIPSGVNFKVDEAAGDSKGMRIEGRIKPEWIKEVLKVDWENDALVSAGPLHNSASLFLCFQVRPTSGTVQNAPYRFRFTTRVEQVAQFQAWLAQQLQFYILGTTLEQVERAWWTQYVQEGYRKGAGRAFDDVKKPLHKPDTWSERLPWYDGTRREFLESSFGRAVRVEKVKLLAGRVFTELKGVTEEMSKNLSRDLTDGLVQGKNAWGIYKDMAEHVGISERRAMLIARTELTRVHAESQLDAMEEMGVEAVNVMVEWSTAGDLRVCKLCQPLEGVVFKIQEARGMIPRHPACRCALLPANVGEGKGTTKVDWQKAPIGQVRTQKGIKGAVKESLKAGGRGDKTTWPGADVSVSKVRPKSIVNVFCPTGEGGGIDPTCKLSVAKIRRAKGTKKDALYLEMSHQDRERVVVSEVLSIKPGTYTLKTRGRAAPSLQEAIESKLGVYAGIDVSEKLIRGMSVQYPNRISSSLTLGLEEVIIHPRSSK